MCFFYNKKEETIKHTLINCDNAKQWWDELSQHNQSILSIPNLLFGQNQWVYTLSRVKQQSFNNLLKLRQPFPFCLWKIWRTRNNCFNNKREHVPYNNAILRNVEFIHVVGGCQGKKPSPVIRVNGHPPRRGSYKLNTDGAIYQKKE